MHFDPSEFYVHLAAGGTAEQLPGGDQFWSRPESELDSLGHGWLVTEFECSSDWPSWEMHPEADEFVYLLSGAAVMLLQQADGLQEVPLLGRAAVVVPPGVKIVVAPIGLVNSGAITGAKIGTIRTRI